MRLNKMTSYGIRIIGRMYLADTLLTSKQLSELENIPQGMVMKVLRKLKEAGIVQSKQGRGEASGGFQLGDNSDQLTLFDVMEAMEDEYVLYPDYDVENYKECMHFYEELKRTNDEFEKELRKTTIRDILGAGE